MAAVKEAIEIYPDFSTGVLKKIGAYKNNAEQEIEIKALRKLGVPE